MEVRNELAVARVGKLDTAKVKQNEGCVLGMCFALYKVDDIVSGLIRLRNNEVFSWHDGILKSNDLWQDKGDKTAQQQPFEHMQTKIERIFLLSPATVKTKKI